MQLIKDIGKDRLDLTIGSSLDIFGGTTISYKDAVLFCRKAAESGDMT
jgi:phosphoribosylformimino-5-aminoimidazole carboxamide ribotide isomerase